MSAAPALKTRLDYAMEYASIGWHVLPLHYITEAGTCSCGAECRTPGKHPATMQGVKNATTNPDIIREWFRKPYNIGIAAGMAVSGFVVVDIDPRNYGDETFFALEKQHGKADDTVIAQTGGGGQHYLYTVPEGQEIAKLGQGIDIVKEGKYIVVEPSNHYTGGEYFWEADYSPLEGVAIMPAPAWMLKPKGEQTQISESWHESDYLTQEAVKDLRSALCYIDADPYEEYIFVLSCLKGSGNTPQTKGLAMEWAQGSSKFDAAEFNKTWSSLKVEGNRTGQLTHTSIFKKAESYGWLNTIHGRIAPAITEPQPLKVKTSERITYNFDQLRIPGVLGDVADWINATSRKPQPLFAVQAALAFGATVLGRKYVTPNRNWTSLYFLNIGKSASGKEHAKWAIEKLLQAAELDHLLGPSRYSSESGVLSALISQPCHIAIIDEFGKYLESSNANGNFMAQDSLKAIIEAWGRNDGMIRPIGYSTFGMSSNQIDDMKDRIVKNPNLSLLSMSTPESFFEAVSSKGVRDGFLNRFLVAHTDIGRQAGRMLDSVPSVPANVISWAVNARMTEQIGNLAKIESPHNIEPNAVVIPFSESAYKRVNKFAAECIQIMDDLEEIGLADMYGRCSEMAMRLSLIIAISCESRVITDEHAAWAIEYVRRIQDLNIYHMKDRLADSPFAAMKNDVLRAITASNDKGMTKREISRAVSSFRAARPGLQKEILQALTEDQDIQLQEIGSTAGRGRKRIAYVAICPE